MVGDNEEYPAGHDNEAYEAASAGGGSETPPARRSRRTRKEDDDTAKMVTDDDGQPSRDVTAVSDAIKEKPDRQQKADARNRRRHELGRKVQGEAPSALCAPYNNL